MPKEGVNGYGAEEADGCACEAGGNDDGGERDSAGKEEVEGDCANEDGEFGAENDAGKREEVEA